MDQETTARFERIETDLEETNATLRRMAEASDKFRLTVMGAITVQQEQIAELTRLSAKHEQQILDMHKQLLA